MPFAKRLDAHFLARNLGLVVGLDPAGDPPGVGVLVGDSHLPQCGPGVRPVVVPEKRRRPLDVAPFDCLRLRPAGPRPVQKSQRPRKPQHMRGPFAEVFTLPPVELVLPVVRKGGKVCEGL